MAKSPKKPAVSRPVQVQTAPPVVDPRWLVRMLGIMLVAALICGYLTLGLLFYVGSWQLVLHPTRKPNEGTALPSEKLRFEPDASGTPQLAGEWLAAPAGSLRSTYAVLYLRAADGQLDAGDGTQIQALHDLGLNVLAFDYRGYGSSAERPHPNESRMLQDAGAAWTYLTDVRKTAADHVLVFSNGVGVSLAVQLLQQHSSAAGLIVYNADPEVLARVRHDPRSHLFPLSLVFHNSFSLNELKTLKTPKLLYTVGPTDAPRREVYASAADPKLTVEVPTHNAQQERDALARFLDSNLPTGVSTLR